MMPSRQAIVGALQDIFAADPDWAVAVDTSHLPWRPDLLLRAKSGRLVPIEVQEGEGQLHFATLALLESIAPRLREDYAAPDVSPILATAKTVSPRLAAAIAGSAVLLIDFSPTAPARDVAASIARLCLSLENGGTPDYREGLADPSPAQIAVQHNLATVAVERGDFEEAVRLLQHLLSMQEHLLGSSHPRSLQTRVELARSMARLGRVAEAERELAACLPELRRVVGAMHPSTLIVMGLYGSVLLQLERYPEARTVLSEALPLQEKTFGPGAGPTNSTRATLASVLGHLGHEDQALALLREVLGQLQQSLGENHPRTKRAMIALASRLVAAGSNQEAIELLTGLVAPHEGNDTDRGDLARARATLALALHGAGQDTKGLEHQALPDLDRSRDWELMHALESISSPRPSDKG